MIRERRIDIATDTETQRAFSDNGEPLSLEEAERRSKQGNFTCPECGAPTFGRFEPFVERGITRWCSNCGYMEHDKATFKAYVKNHPETIERE